jgi:pimeloyl-ACP methyl ester carboxylesterase
MRAAFIDVDGVRTRYLYEGSGPPLFLLHGVGVSGDTFCRNIDALAAHFTVCAPDMLGHGFTEAVDYLGGPPQPHIVRHLGRLADLLGYRTYAVAGSSFGGLIAALMYFDRPQRVDRLILIGSGSVFHTAEDQIKTLKAAFANAATAMGAPTLASCRDRLANICYKPEFVAEEILLLQLTSYALPDRFAAYKATIQGMIDELSSADPERNRVLQRLDSIKVPTLILTGRKDIRAKLATHEAGVKRIPRARLVVFDQCNHLPYMEYPQKFNDAVIRFMADAREYSEAHH